MLFAFYLSLWIFFCYSVKIQSLKTGKISRGTPDLAGYNLYAAEGNLLGSGCSCAIGAGVKLDMDSGLCAMVLGRSGIALGHFILTHPGLIDPDYRGEIKVIVHNISSRSFRVANGDRIAQLVFMRKVYPEFSKVENFSPSKRGSRGFGTTGK